MKRIVLYPAVCGALLCGLVFYFVFGKGEAQAQMSADTAPLVRRTAESSKRADVEPKEAPANYSRFSKASTENARLQSSLQWTFGGKAQAGWSLYSLLIGETIGTESSPNSPEFAGSLAKWQAREGIADTGILDRPTLEAFIKTWQSQRRVGDSMAGQILSAPISEFYDSTRGAELLQLERETYYAYKRMIAAAAKDLSADLIFTKSGELAEQEKFLRIVSAFRSPAYQAQLRKREPNAGRAALAKNSVHSTGRALDLYVGGEPVITKDANRAIQINSPAYKWLVKNAGRFGFYPYFYEPWHWEYVPGK